MTRVGVDLTHRAAPCTRPGGPGSTPSSPSGWSSTIARDDPISAARVPRSDGRSTSTTGGRHRSQRHTVAAVQPRATAMIVSPSTSASDAGGRDDDGEHHEQHAAPAAK